MNLDPRLDRISVSNARVLRAYRTLAAKWQDCPRVMRQGLYVQPFRHYGIKPGPLDLLRFVRMGLHPDSQDVGRHLRAEGLIAMSTRPHAAIRVISLPAALERRQAFARSAAAAGCEWEFFDAHATPVYGLSYDEKRVTGIYSRSCTRVNSVAIQVISPCGGGWPKPTATC